jgi:hypothetical protein
MFVDQSELPERVHRVETDQRIQKCCFSDLNHGVLFGFPQYGKTSRQREKFLDKHVSTK